MKKENAIDILNRDILLLEAKRNEQFLELKEEMLQTIESLKPVNFIKNVFKSATESPEITNGFSKAALGVTSGHLIKKLLFGSSHNPLKRMAGIAVQAIVTNLVSNNTEKIQESGKGIFNTLKSLIISNKKTPSEVEF
ncbi:MAG: hypothetical protein H7141_11340 [Burkholderiales bacterium]|nr:hypothetical protein [Bacteroidia bacterium]